MLCSDIQVGREDPCYRSRNLPAFVCVCVVQVMRIVDNVRPDRQTVMFSATFPRAMEALARRILTKPVEVPVGGRSVVSSDVEQHVVRR